MGKFAMECPKCHAMNTASTFIFSKKTITCGKCGEEIDVKQSRLTSKRCECGQVVVCDQAKLNTADKRSKRAPACPSCGRTLGILNATSTYEGIEIDCPQCYCRIEVDKTKNTDFCPVCDKLIDVKTILAKEKLKSNTGISIIKYEGDNSTFVWKHPVEDFNMGSQLIVHESQEAILFLNGQALDLFGPGRYTLETENLPILKQIAKLPTDGQTPFHAEVYFINQTVQMSIKWGTDSRVRFIEPDTGLPLDLGASGEMNLQVVDSRKLLVKLVGTTSGISWDADSGTFGKSLKACFRPQIVTTIKSYLASVIKAQQLDILEIDQYLSELSLGLQEKLAPGFEEYGLGVAQFYVTNVSLPEDDPNFKQMRDLRTVAFQHKKADAAASLIASERKIEIERQATETEKLRWEAERRAIKDQAEAHTIRSKGIAEADVLAAKGKAEAEIMAAKGYTQRDVLQADVQKAYAEGIGKMGANGASVVGGGGSNMMNDLLGLGVGFAAMEKMGTHVNKAMKGMLDGDEVEEAPKKGWACSCGFDRNTGKFCSSCGKPKAEAWDCTTCGAKGNTGRFCAECGVAKPEAWECTACGAKGNTGKFCAECGRPKASKQSWDCPKCGAKGNVSKFCAECGAPKAEQPATWDCDCGNKGIAGQFCTECGKKKGG